MNKYNSGKVYSLFSNKSGKKYIGSTTESHLCKRLAGHQSAYKRYLAKKGSYTTSFEILKDGDYYMSLLESVNCNNIDELRMKEREWILKLDCVNKVVPLRTPAEYYQDNIIIITAKKSKMVICECGGRYRTDNKCHHLETDKHFCYMNEKMSNELKILYPSNNIVIGDVVEYYSHNLIPIDELERIKK